MGSSANLQVAIGHLSESGGLKNCDPSCWDEYLQIEGKRLSTDRPLVIGVGAAGFSANGRGGELPAPTSELSKAFVRAIKRVRATGRHVVTLSPDEFRTTMCCCACGAVTRPPVVRRWRRDRETREMIAEDGPSRRLRCCTSCEITGKLRDRDVQGARNILWLTYARICRERPIG